MNEPSRLNRLATEARKRCVDARAERERHRGTAPARGDVFRLAETADLAVLWALVEHDAERKRFLAIAADLNPFIASTDVATPPDSGCGSLSLRCRVGVWLDEEAFDGATRAGSLDPDIVEQVRQKRRQIAPGGVGPLFARETDIDPEYRDWLEEGPEKAQAVFLRRPATRSAPPEDAPGKILGFLGPVRGTFFGVPASLAASALLVVSVGLLAGLVWQSRGPGRSAEELVHVPFAILSTEQVRNEGETLEVPASVSSFLLLVETSTPYPAYRLEIRRKDNDVLAWESSALEPTKERRARFEPILLPVVLPRQALATGEYRVLLFGLRNGRVEALEEHLLRVRMK